MNRYLIISPHTAANCTKALKQVEAIGVMTRYDWGCKDGEHCGWVTIEADSKIEALLVVPTIERPSAKVVELTKFSPDDLRAAH